MFPLNHIRTKHYTQTQHTGRVRVHYYLFDGDWQATDSRGSADFFSRLLFRFALVVGYLFFLPKKYTPNRHLRYERTQQAKKSKKKNRNKLKGSDWLSSFDAKIVLRQRRVGHYRFAVHRKDPFLCLVRRIICLLNVPKTSCVGRMIIINSMGGFVCYAQNCRAHVWARQTWNESVVCSNFQFHAPKMF